MFFHKEIQNYTHEKDRLQLFPLKIILKNLIRSIRNNVFPKPWCVPVPSFFFCMQYGIRAMKLLQKKRKIFSKLSGLRERIDFPGIPIHRGWTLILLKAVLNSSIKTPIPGTNSTSRGNSFFPLMFVFHLPTRSMPQVGLPSAPMMAVISYPFFVYHFSVWLIDSASFR